MSAPADTVTTTKTYEGDVLICEVDTHTSGPDVSATREYSGGVLTREIVLHTDGSKDVFIYGITGQSYANQHDAYNAAWIADRVYPHACR